MDYSWRWRWGGGEARESRVEGLVPVAREPHGQRHARTGPEERGVGRIYSGLGMDILFTTHEEIGTEYRQNCWYREDKEVTIVYISPSGLPPPVQSPRDERREPSVHFRLLFRSWIHRDGDTFAPPPPVQRPVGWKPAAGWGTTPNQFHSLPTQRRTKECLSRDGSGVHHRRSLNLGDGQEREGGV